MITRQKGKSRRSYLFFSSNQVSCPTSHIDSRKFKKNVNKLPGGSSCWKCVHGNLLYYEKMSILFPDFLKVLGCIFVVMSNSQIIGILSYNEVRIMMFLWVFSINLLDYFHAFLYLPLSSFMRMKTHSMEIS
jgi:hypothetical protein